MQNTPIAQHGCSINMGHKVQELGSCFFLSFFLETSITLLGTKKEEKEIKTTVSFLQIK